MKLCCAQELDVWEKCTAGSINNLGVGGWSMGRLTFESVNGRGADKGGICEWGMGEIRVGSVDGYGG